MVTVMTIRGELVEATGASGENVGILVEAVYELSDVEWEALSEDAQKWVNSAVDAKNAAAPLPPFPDEDELDEEEEFEEEEAEEVDEEEEEEVEEEEYEEEEEPEDSPAVDELEEEEIEPPEEEEEEPKMVAAPAKRKRMKKQKSPPAKKKTTKKKTTKKAKKSEKPSRGRGSKNGREFFKTMMKHPTWDKTKVLASIDKRGFTLTEAYASNLWHWGTTFIETLHDEGLYTLPGFFEE